MTDAGEGEGGSLYARLRRAGRGGLAAALAVRRHAASDPRECISYLASRDGQKFGLAVGANAERRRMVRAADAIDAMIPCRPGAAKAARAASDVHCVPRYALAWYYLARTHRPRTVVETGVSFGTSTFMILLALERNGGAGRLHSIDDGAGIGLPDGAGVGYLVPGRMRGRWRLATGDTMSLLGPILSDLGEIGMFVHDSAHVEDVMTFEYEAAWERLGPGGVLASDDVNTTGSWQRFAARHSGEIGDSCTFQEMARPSDSEYPRPDIAYCVKRSGAAAAAPAEPRRARQGSKGPAAQGGGPSG